MSAAFRDILSSLDGWSVDSNIRRGKWRFVAFSGSAGESGDSMLHLFRRANNLSNAKYNELFIHRSDLLSEDFGPDDFVVFVDDFSGTGDQACSAWRDTFQELLSGDPTIYLVLIAASHHARVRISNETNMEVVPHIELNDRDDFFSSSCKHFNRQEKDSIFRYCEIADMRNPRGYGDCGFVIVFQHSCPNDSLPILHVDKRKWEGLFRRYD